jgi:hypothetical protein
MNELKVLFIEYYTQRVCLSHFQFQFEESKCINKNFIEDGIKYRKCICANDVKNLILFESQQHKVQCQVYAFKLFQNNHSPATSFRVFLNFTPGFPLLLHSFSPHLFILPLFLDFV